MAAFDTTKRVDTNFLYLIIEIKFKTLYYGWRRHALPLHLRLSFPLPGLFPIYNMKQVCFSRVPLV